MERRKRLQDGISRVQKVAAVEIGFRGAPGCFQGMQVYIGEGSRSGEPRGAHEGGGHAHPPRRDLHPRGPSVAPPTYFFLLYIPTYPENIQGANEKQFPPS